MYLKYLDILECWLVILILTDHPGRPSYFSHENQCNWTSTSAVKKVDPILNPKELWLMLVSAYGHSICGKHKN